ncbi:MAG: hypothetical protein ABIS07_11550 [Dokdonella sp.]
MKYLLMAVFAAVMVAPLVAVAGEKPEAAVNASSKDDFQTVAVWVRKEMTPGGRYSYVSDAERSTVNKELDNMNRLFEQTGDVAHMNDQQKTQMFNSQEQVNSLLGKHDNERLVCKNELPIGSHIPVKTCQTAGMIEARRRNDVQYLQRTQNSPQLRSGS